MIWYKRERNGRVSSCKVLLVKLSFNVSYCNLPYHHIRNIAWVLTQPLTETSTGKFPVGQALPVRETDNLAAICDPTF
jgi:hypothetical protein